jgi:hypothetical protein
MTNNYNITRETFTQSQIFKNILSIGAKTTSFLQQTEFSPNKQAEAANLIKDLEITCEQLAVYQEKDWQIIRHTEIVDDITEYISKAKAMLDMELNTKRDEISAETLHNYFWEILSLIDAIDSVFEDLR